MVKSKEIKLNLPKGKSLGLWMYLAVIMLFTMLFFNYFLDMGITAWHASDFLDSILSGKGLDFYQIVYDKAEAGAYFGKGAAIYGAIYSPLVYIFISVLILPIYLPGKIVGLSIDPSIYAEFLRLEMLGFAIWAAALVKSILDKQGYVNAIVSYRFMFLSSPFFLYCVLAGNQYDIVVVVIALYAFRAYIDGNMRKSVTFIALSAIFKPFTLIMFIPMVLYKEKNVIKDIVYLIVSVAPMGLLSIICNLALPGYSATQHVMHDFYNFGDYIFQAKMPGSQGNFSIFVVAYCIVCVIAFIMKYDAIREFRTVVLLGISAYMVFILFVPFHGQWGVFILPFLVMAVACTESQVNALLMTIGFESGFAITLCHVTEMRIMLGNSIMAANYNSPNADWDFYRHYFDSSDIPFSFMVGFGIALMVVLVVDYVRGNSSVQEKDNEVKPWMLLVKASTMLLFTVPPVMCFLGIIH